MKKIVLVAMLIVSLKCWSHDTAVVKPAMVEQYCQVLMVPTGGLFEVFKKNMDVDYGNEAKASKDNRLKMQMVNTKLLIQRWTPLTIWANKAGR